MFGPRGAPPSTLGALARRHLGAYVAGTACVGVSQLALNRVDWLSKSAIDQLFGADPHSARGPIVGILALAVVAFAAQVGSHWLVYNAGRDAEYELRGELLHRLHSLGTGFYGKTSAGEIMSRASSDLAQVQLLLGFGVLTMIGAALTFASTLQVMFGVSWRLALASLVIAPLLVPVTRVLNRRLFQRTRASQDAVGRVTQVVQTNAANMRVVRSLALESRELQRFEDANDVQLATSVALARTRGIVTAFIGGVIAVGGLVFFWYGGSLLLQGPGSRGISRGEFFAFWLAFEQLFFPMIVLGVAIAVVQRGRAGHARLAEILAVAPDVVDGPDPAPAVTRGALTVKNLGFRHGDRQVLEGVSFEVPAGGSIAIVGRTGSGKSTLAALLARMLPTPRGAVFLDGKDTCDLPLAYVRGAIGYAQQEAFLFSTTVARNIGFALDHPDSREATAAIRSAAREAQVEPEILSLPERFDTVVGERGVQLSGGQRQRVALARAFVRPSSVLVLDDPISAVDARTEGMILGALERQAGMRTLVLVTHHVAAAARCAEIVVLDEGRIVERGTHAALVAAGGLYAAFAEEQSLADQLGAIEPEEAPASKPPASSDDPRPAAAAEQVRAFHDESAVAGSSDARLVLRLVALLRPHARLFFLSMGALVLVTGAALARPVLMGRVIDRAAAGDAHGLVDAGLLLTAFTLALFGLRFLQTYLVQIGGARAIADLRLRVVRLLQRLPLGTFDRTPVGRLVARATVDIDAVGEIFASGVLNAIGDLLQVAGILAMMLALDWRLALVAFASVPVLGAVAAVGRGPWRRASRDIRGWTARLSAILNEQINGMAVVQAYGRQRAMSVEHDEVSRAHRRANGRAIFYQAVFDASLMLVNLVCVASVLLCADARSGGVHAVGFAILVTFTEYVWQFFAPVSMIASRYMALQTGLAGAERVFDFLDTNDTLAAEKDAGALAAEGPPEEAVRFEGVTFGYGSVPVLHDLTLAVKRGERVALVGATGAGKSTVASLALRLYEPQAGTIRVLGKDVRAYAANALRERFSVVPQDVLLFAGTVLSNVGASDERPDLGRARAALARVGALETFESRPGGVEAPVGERGANLSAGERQLIAFARAIYRDAPILLLDEATASIDSSTETRLQRALAAVMEGRTVLVIAHRLSTIRMLDRIAVFHRGRMVELGSHDELLAQSGVYARLHRMQFARTLADARTHQG